jgi:hypothetical protein
MRLSRPADQEAVDLEKADLADPVLYGEGDPHAVWRAMRERDPVHWQQGHDGLGFWSVTTYDDVSRVLRDYTDFTSEHGTLLNLLGKEDPASRRQLPATDPPRHTRMRSPIQRALNSRIIETHSEYIREEVRGLLDTVQDGVPFDFAELTGQLPMAVTGTLMGLDRADWPRLTYLTSQAIAPDDPEFITAEGGEATLHRAHRELLASFQDAMSRRLERGLQEDGDGGDLIDLLLTMKLEDGRRMGAGEIVSNCYSLRNANHDAAATARFHKAQQEEKTMPTQAPGCLHGAVTFRSQLIPLRAPPAPSPRPLYRRERGNPLPRAGEGNRHEPAAAAATGMAAAALPAGTAAAVRARHASTAAALSRTAAISRSGLPAPATAAPQEEASAARRPHRNRCRHRPRHHGERYLVQGQRRLDHAVRQLGDRRGHGQPGCHAQSCAGQDRLVLRRPGRQRRQLPGDPRESH